MNKKFIAAAVASVLAAPMTSHAAQVVGEKLEVYGKVHLSVDSSDRDDPAVSNDGLSISSNSSRIGFKGKLPTGNMYFVYKMEQEVRMDQSGSTFASRNTYGGISGDFGMVILGKHDTPFKNVGSKWGIFGDTIADRRMILGAGYTSGNKFNARAENMIMYQYKAKAITFQVLHAVDPSSSAGGSVDNNDQKVTSAAVFYKTGGLWLAGGYETWTGNSNLGGNGDGDMMRLAAKYDFGSFKLGAIYESISPDVDTNEFNRDVWGINGAVKVGGKTSLQVQYLVADEANNQPDTGANSIGVGVFHKLDKGMKVYLAYVSTDNDANAQYQAVDGGHGDEVKTALGGSPSSISAGFQYKF